MFPVVTPEMVLKQSPPQPRVCFTINIHPVKQFEIVYKTCNRSPQS